MIISFFKNGFQFIVNQYKKYKEMFLTFLSFKTYKLFYFGTILSSYEATIFITSEALLFMIKIYLFITVFCLYSRADFIFWCFIIFLETDINICTPTFVKNLKL